ncbi:hypothetical protein [Flavihumibacter fluvii]|uniref:hypothetical protein n=1 Tax=Flavihumibacter fluvii TaxID=2838157 RepID=UPI001BDDF52E|nr:hypothetical protein [Flavihumibacter fluvii]ULQ53239.1 hypothetical protein KJS93_02780 [Flavihumibacter fluvii]
MPLKPGTISDFDSSMAKSMEEAFLAEWKNAMGDADAPEPNNQMRLLFVAIAQGLVKHLHENPDAFRIDNFIGSFHLKTGLKAIESNLDP